MKIDLYFNEFIRTYSPKYEKDLRNTAKTLLTGDKDYSLSQMPGFDESECLPQNIRESVKKIPRGKNTAVKIYQKLVDFLRGKGIEISVSFPTIPIDYSFERQMFIAKYLQDKNAHVSDLEDLLWVSNRTIDQDLQRLYRTSDDPIQICGRPFFIPDSTRINGQIRSASTVHPLFLTENLTQVIIMLKGLRVMAGNELFTQYAKATAADIWMQLSDYAKTRIRFVFSELMPEELQWYEGLENPNVSFYSEYQCSFNRNVWMDCIKNGKDFFIEYRADDGTVFYKNCRFVPGSYQHRQESNDIVFDVDCDKGHKTIISSRVIRSAYSSEELVSD